MKEIKEFKEPLTYKPFRVGWYEDRYECFKYFYTELEARDFWIDKKQENNGTEAWYDRLVNDEEYETIETYYPDDDEFYPDYEL